MESKDEKIKEEIRHLAAKFLQRESNQVSLITVTNVALTNKGAMSTVYFTVLPETKEKAALDFVKRKRTEFREYVGDNSKIGRIPFFDFEIDLGEKNRQLIDNISNLDNKV